MTFTVKALPQYALSIQIFCKVGYRAHFQTLVKMSVTISHKNFLNYLQSKYLMTNSKIGNHDV